MAAKPADGHMMPMPKGTPKMPKGMPTTPMPMHPMPKHPDRQTHR